MNNGTTTPERAQVPKLHAGMRLQLMEVGSRRTMMSASVSNPIVAIFNAFANLKVVRQPAQPDANGNRAATGTLILADTNAVIHLQDA